MLRRLFQLAVAAALTVSGCSQGNDEAGNGTATTTDAATITAVVGTIPTTVELLPSETESAGRSVPVGYRLVDCTRHGFTIVLPSSWAAMNYAAGDINEILAAFDSLEPGDSEPELRREAEDLAREAIRLGFPSLVATDTQHGASQVWVGREFARSRSLAHFTDELKSQMLEDGMTVTAEDRTLVDGHEAAMVTAEADYGGFVGVMTTRWVSVIANDYAYVIIAGSNAPDALDAVLPAILESIAFE